ncbi:sulfurtransferase complex subunit TusD [Aliidiomarina minuta]|uniref:Sulfurtransferase complex subunit TusD n=1 Tax=Aliidiomarina minuta TaxID=880057 RepID=A0A432W718_9GAMM|nr:sulfurtransferase complex subunit TusD [Aliidiomarina minuta]RUO25870.1 sulfurtransferase complex subunit TusD [Aliidiomarina minuta]
MASFTLIIQHGPHQGHHSYSALQFAKAALQKQHEIKQVFFYGDAVQHGNALAHRPGDEQDSGALWQAFAEQHGIELVICATVGARHGVVPANDLPDFAQGNLTPGYQAGGLAEYMAAQAESDHLVQF